MFSNLLLPLPGTFAGLTPAPQSITFRETARVQLFRNDDAATAINTVGGSKEEAIIIFSPQKAVRNRPKLQVGTPRKPSSTRIADLPRGRAQTRARKRLAERIAGAQAHHARMEVTGEAVLRDISAAERAKLIDMQDEGFPRFPERLAIAYNSTISYLLRLSEATQLVPATLRIRTGSSDLHVHLTAMVKLLPILAAARRDKYCAAQQEIWDELHLALWHWLSSAEHKRGPTMKAGDLRDELQDVVNDFRTYHPRDVELNMDIQTLVEYLVFAARKVKTERDREMMRVAKRGVTAQSKTD